MLHLRLFLLFATGLLLASSCDISSEFNARSVTFGHVTEIDTVTFINGNFVFTLNYFVESNCWKFLDTNTQQLADTSFVSVIREETFETNCPLDTVFRTARVPIPVDPGRTYFFQFQASDSSFVDTVMTSPGQ